MENSIDAGATQIEIDIINGGHDLIQIKDNGCGMSIDDAMLAMERHTTSKIKDIEDLQNISSMGFRGEALASISSVSNFILITSNNDKGEGVKLVVEGEDITKQTIATPKGTTVVVKNLFYNVPARRKFLKTTSTELDRKSTRLNSSHTDISRMPSSA